MASNLNIAIPGRSHFLLKKKKAKPVKIRESEEEDKYIDMINEKDQEIDELRYKMSQIQDELEKSEDKNHEISKHSELLAHLYDKGVIDSEGKLICDAID